MIVRQNKATDSSKEKKFLACKEKLKNKFELLFLTKYKCEVNRRRENVKECVLNLTEESIPEHHKSLLNLGPKFAITPNKIPYMDIITTTEVTALKLEKGNRLAEAEK